jgi:Zinc carboxypeptidase
MKAPNPLATAYVRLCSAMAALNDARTPRSQRLARHLGDACGPLRKPRRSTTLRLLPATLAACAFGLLAPTRAASGSEPRQSPAPAHDTAAAVASQDNERLPGFPGLAANRRPSIEIPWNRLYPLNELYGHFDCLAAAHPDWFSATTIGTSVGGRELRVYQLAAPQAADLHLPAMWIDGNVHGNEVQGSEAILYLAWYLLENKDSSPRVAELLARVRFYLLPSVNPDGRDHWFYGANNASSSRSGIQPLDSDRDGLFDEDPANDLDGDGSLTQMRKYLPGEGDYRLDPSDPRRMLPVDYQPGRPRGDWIMLGEEGIDDDQDGRLNEDGLGGYDMNRAWPSFWAPNFVQFGAGPYPLYWPETRAIAEFILAHPEIGAVQSFHNSGGMILRGPGAEPFGEYPDADTEVYNALGRDGEKMLPFYRYMVIWRDLYTVFGGFVNWTYEGLGIISFTNEMWSERRLSPDDRLPDGREGDLFFNDSLLFGAGFTPWQAFDHPLYGPIEIGGFQKDVGRVPPSFLLEEEHHRNALFCLRHAEALPEVELKLLSITPLPGQVFAIDIEAHNRRLIPTRTSRATQKGIGLPDQLSLTGPDLRILQSGPRSDRFRPELLTLSTNPNPGTIQRDEGLFFDQPLRYRFFVTGSGPFQIRYQGQKAAPVEIDGQLP